MSKRQLSKLGQQIAETHKRTLYAKKVPEELPCFPQPAQPCSIYPEVAPVISTMALEEQAIRDVRAAKEATQRGKQAQEILEKQMRELELLRLKAQEKEHIYELAALQAEKAAQAQARMLEERQMQMRAQSEAVQRYAVKVREQAIEQTEINARSMAKNIGQTIGTQAAAWAMDTVQSRTGEIMNWAYSVAANTAAKQTPATAQVVHPCGCTSQQICPCGTGISYGQ